MTIIQQAWIYLGKGYTSNTILWQFPPWTQALTKGGKRK